METGIGSKIDLDGIPWGLIGTKYRRIVEQIVLILVIISTIEQIAKNIFEKNVRYRAKVFLRTADKGVISNGHRPQTKRDKL